MQSKALSAKNIAFRVYGDYSGPEGPLPLVFLHGLLGYASNWGKIWPQFSSRRAVLVYDQRGHGRSGKPDSGYSLQDYAADFLALLDHLGWEQVHLIGHSLGGRIAMQCCKSYPERVAKLVIEDVGPEPRPHRVEIVRQILADVPAPFADRVSAKEFFTRYFRSEPMLGDFLFSNLHTTSTGQVDWRFRVAHMQETMDACLSDDLSALFASIPHDTLVIRGGASDAFTGPEAERMRASRPNVQLVTIPDAGHFVHAAKPQEFSAALQRFIA